jgi:hypothetical protein
VREVSTRYSPAACNKGVARQAISNLSPDQIPSDILVLVPRTVSKAAGLRHANDDTRVLAQSGVRRGATKLRIRLVYISSLVATAAILGPSSHMRCKRREQCGAVLSRRQNGLRLSGTNLS